MSSSKASYFPQLDGIRALAILAVMVGHWLSYPWINNLAIGPSGVFMFFVLSGFLITRILLKFKDQIGSGETTLGQTFKIFYARRALRIFPIYYVLLGVTYLFTPSTRPSILWNLTYTSNFYLISKGDWGGPMSHYWSLSVEEQFYLIWPLLIFMVPKHYLKQVMGAVILGTVALRMALWFNGFSFLTVYILTPACLDMFAIGGLLAYMHLYEEERLYKWLANWSLLITVSILYVFCVLSHVILPKAYEFFYPTLFRFFFAWVIFWMVGHACRGIKGWGGKLLEHPWLRYIGRISYSLYLFHNFMDGFFLGIPYPEHPFGRFWLYFAGAMIVSTVSYYLVELPFQRLKKYFPYPKPSSASSGLIESAHSS